MHARLCVRSMCACVCAVPGRGDPPCQLHARSSSRGSLLCTDLRERLGSFEPDDRQRTEGPSNGPSHSKKSLRWLGVRGLRVWKHSQLATSTQRHQHHKPSPQTPATPCIGTVSSTTNCNITKTTNIANATTGSSTGITSSVDTDITTCVCVSVWGVGV